MYLFPPFSFFFLFAIGNIFIYCLLSSCTSMLHRHIYLSVYLHLYQHACNCLYFLFIYIYIYKYRSWNRTNQVAMGLTLLARCIEKWNASDEDGKKRTIWRLTYILAAPTSQKKKKIFMPLTFLWDNQDAMEGNGRLIYICMELYRGSYHGRSMEICDSSSNSTHFVFLPHSFSFIESAGFF